MSEPFHRRTVTQSSVSEPPTQPAGWYPTDGDSTQTPAGDRRRATPTTLGWMSAIALLGTGVVMLGGRVATSIPAWSYPHELRNYYCFGEGEGDGTLYTGIGWLVAVWVLLVALCAASVVLWRRAGVGDRRVSRLAVAGIVTTVVLCPVWLVIGAGADCGM